MNTPRTRLAAAAFACLAVVPACSSSTDSTEPAGPDATGRTTTTTTRRTTLTTSQQSTNTGNPSLRSFRLQEFDSCEALLDDIKDLALKRVGPYGLNSYQLWLEGVPMPASGEFATTAAAAATTAAPAPVLASRDAVAGSSTTNTQEVGIDEGDIAENDGRYVYAVANGTLLSIVDTTTGERVSMTTLEPGSQQLVLDGTRLVVVTGSWNAMPMTGVGIRSSTMLPNGITSTIVTVFDVTDRSAPKELSRSTFEGTALAVRASDGVVRIVAQSAFGAALPFMQPTRQTQTALDKAMSLNREVIEDSTIDDWLPQFALGGASGTGRARAALACEDVARPREYSGMGLTWVASIDLDADEPTVMGSGGVIAEGGQVYASAANLYVATTRWNEPGPDPDVTPVRPEPAKTAIHQFEVEGGRATYVASGSLAGTLLNSYSMSEHEGVLRVATTKEDPNFGMGTESGVHVLQKNGDELTEIGSVGGLGKTERIYAVRFLGTQAYVVTFRQTDPLYVIDLADPTAPALVGELKIPGYSSYLHPIGDGLVLGVGQNATDAGQVLGTQLSLFDVSDPTKPSRLSTVDIGGMSEAEYDAHAFLWWGQSRQVVVPKSGYDRQTGIPESGAIVVRVADDALEVNGNVASPSAFGGQVRRSMIVDGRLVLLTDDALAVHTLDTLELAHRATLAG